MHRRQNFAQVSSFENIWIIRSFKKNYLARFIFPCMYLQGIMLCSQDTVKHSTSAPIWQARNKLKPIYNKTSFFHAGYEFTGKSIPFAGYTFYQAYSASPRYPENSKKFVRFEFLMDVGGGLFINGPNTKFASHLGFQYIIDWSKHSSLIHPCIGFNSTQVWDRSFSQAFFPEIGLSMCGVMDIRYGYQLVRTGVIETLPGHSIIFTIRPGIFLNWFDKNP
jgi:hypothetical protein